MNSLDALGEDARPRKILVVDDDPLVSDVVVESIRVMGHQVHLCDNGLEALELTGHDQFDLVVTDMRLPGMDGLSLIRRFRESGLDTDVIVVTGFGSVENAVDCMRAGALDYIIKPFSVDQIQLAVQRALEHRDLRRRALEGEYYRELSYLDGLTGVYNRRFFDEALPREMSKAERHRLPLLLFMIDIDDFKTYNEANLHQGGDEALAQIGEVLKKACRAYDIVTRYGGDEFAVLFPGAGKDNVHELSGRITRDVRNYPFNGLDALPSGHMSVSIGAACYPDDATTPRELVRKADEAMARAKLLGKDRLALYERGA